MATSVGIRMGESAGAASVAMTLASICRSGGIAGGAAAAALTNNAHTPQAIWLTAIGPPRNGQMEGLALLDAEHLADDLAAAQVLDPRLRIA